MKRRCFASIVLALALPVLQGAANTSTADRIIRHFQQRNLAALQALPSGTVERLPLVDRNAVALAAAKSLSIEPYRRAIGNKPIPKHFTKPEEQDSPAEAECRRQWGINMSAAELLRKLAESRLITEPQVLGYLIEGLDHPDHIWVGRNCFYALQHLTRRSTGERYWGQGVPDPARHKQVVRWWRGWWEENQAKHPVFDLELERAARGEVLRLCRIIEQLEPRFPELGDFTIPQLPLCWQRPLFFVLYDPGRSATLPFGVSPERLPWILVSCRFRTVELPDQWAHKADVDPPRKLRAQVRTSYSRVVPGSDLLVEVKLASRNDALVRALESALGTPVSAASDPDD